jgi:competence protein ComEA
MKTIALLAALCAMALTPLAHADPPARPSAPAAPHAAPPPEASADGVVNVNTAAPDELERVPGIGPARADAIVRLRERVTRFRHVEDLVRVRGIGRATLRAMRPYLTLDGPTTLVERPGRRRANE